MFVFGHGLFYAYGDHTHRLGQKIPIYEIFLCPEHRTGYVHVFKSAGTTIADVFMGVCNLTLSWYQYSKSKHGETFHARLGHAWGVGDDARWKNAHDRFRAGWLRGASQSQIVDNIARFRGFKMAPTVVIRDVFCRVLGAKHLES